MDWVEVLGAIETLRNFREAKAESGIDADALLRRVEHMQSRIVVFSSEFEPEQRLNALVGVAVLLRFKVDQWGADMRYVLEVVGA